MAKTGTILDLIGTTSFLRLSRFDIAGAAALYAKIEAANPGGSIKDRIVRSMIADAVEAGLLKAGVSTIIEPTSGNTGIGLAMAGAALGYKVILTMPESMSLERRALLAAHGAELVLTPAAEGMAGAIKEAKRLTEETPDAWMPNQFTNPATPRAHYETTGPEIASDLGGKAPDYIIAGVGTGGTISGAGRYLKELDAHTKVIAVEPAESPLITQTRAGEPLAPAGHGIQGIGPNFIPETLDLDILDDVITVSTSRAIEVAREISLQEGLVVGISSGANLAAALEIAARSEAQGKTIVTIFPDTGERYFSTPLWKNLNS